MFSFGKLYISNILYKGNLVVKSLFEEYCKSAGVLAEVAVLCCCPGNMNLICLNPCIHEEFWVIWGKIWINCYFSKTIKSRLMEPINFYEDRLMDDLRNPQLCKKVYIYLHISEEIVQWGFLHLVFSITRKIIKSAF